jgi:galactokinase
MNEIDPALVQRVKDRFGESFPGEPPRLAAAPGRVNLIGEHTDYNDGFVLPLAIGRHAVVAFRPRGDGVLRAHSIAFDETRDAEVASLAPPGGHDWFAYVAGVVWAFASEGLPVCGLELVVDGDVPIGAGLSSSAAIEMATARALAAATGTAWDAGRMAKLGQRAENRYVGVSCGIMDQFASAACEAGSALLVDCRSLETRPVPVPDSVAVVVMDTGARRKLADSAYNERRASCERVVAEVARTKPGTKALRDVNAEDLEAARPRLDEADWKAREPRGGRDRTAPRAGGSLRRGRPREGGTADEGLTREPSRPLRGLVRGARPHHRARAAPAVLLRRAHDRGRLRRLRHSARRRRRRLGLLRGGAVRLQGDLRASGRALPLPARGRRPAAGVDSGHPIGTTCLFLARARLGHGGV